MNILIITQARYGSSRLPGKVLKNISGKTMLEIHLERLRFSRLANKIIVATTHEPESQGIVEAAEKAGCLWHKGSLNDVLDRFYQTAIIHNPDIIVRVTSDCPLIDGSEIDRILTEFLLTDADYMSNILVPTYPDGLDIEVFKFGALKTAWLNARDAREREHVTPYIWGHPDIFKLVNFPDTENNSQYRITVDNEEDLFVVTALISKLGTHLPWRKYLEVLKTDTLLLKYNGHYSRNEKF